MRKLFMVVVAVVAGIASGLAVASPSVAATTDTLQITITPLYPTADLPVSAVLTCEPVGGTHPYAKIACADLAAAGGDVAAIPAQKGVGCLAVWRPVSTTVSGSWSGREISFKDVESNIGCARISHGYLFMI